MLHNKILTARDAEILNSGNGTTPALYLNITSNRTGKALDSIKPMNKIRPIIDCIYRKLGSTYYGNSGGQKSTYQVSPSVFIGKPIAGVALQSALHVTTIYPELLNKMRRYWLPYNWSPYSGVANYSVAYICTGNPQILEICKKFEEVNPYKLNIFIRRNLPVNLNTLELAASPASVSSPFNYVDILMPVYGQVANFKELSKEKVIITL
jgi:hypothetical protein